MTKEEKIQKIESLKKKVNDLKKEVDYYNALQLALKLVLNGSYGAFATSYFILYNNHVAGTITAQGRDLTKTMDKVNEKATYNLYGGDAMEKWASTFLNGERDLVRDKKDASANINNNTGLERKNPFLKKHTKKPQGINLGIKSNSEKSVASALFEEINRMKQIINH